MVGEILFLWRLEQIRYDRVVGKLYEWIGLACSSKDLIARLNPTTSIYSLLSFVSSPATFERP